MATCSPSGRPLPEDEPLSPQPASFTRDTGGTEAEWLRWLRGAVGTHRLSLPGPGTAWVDIGSGGLALSWQPLPPRRIALVSLPRLQVSYRFERISAAEQAEFMRYFDLFMQRGGG